MCSNINIGKLIFSKEKSFEASYYVEDPYLSINKFFALKLEKFGFIEIDEMDVGKMLIGEIVPLDSIDSEYKFAVSGNRFGNFEYHLPSILSNLLDGKNVWISSQLLPDVEEKIKNGELKELDGVKVIMINNYDESIDEGFITNKSVSALIGLFGKFFWKNMSKTEAKIFGKVQDSVIDGTPIDKEDVLTMIKVVNFLYAKEKEEKDIPPANIFNKVKEALNSLL